MQKRHVTLGPNGLLVFDYVAKSGKQRVQSVVDPPVYDVVAKLKKRAAAAASCSAFKDGRSWVDVRSGRHQRVHQGGRRRGFLREGLSHLARDRARGGRAGRVGGRGRLEDGRWSGRSRARSRRSPTTSGTRRPCAAPPTSTRGSSTATATASRSAARSTSSAMLDLGEPATRGAIEEAVLDLLEESESPALEKVA